MISLEEAIKGYQRALIGQGRSPGTKSSYGHLLAMWGRWLAPRGIHWTKVQEIDITDYLEEYAEGHSSTSTALFLTCLRSFYKWARRRGHVPNSPAEDIDPIQRQRALPRALPRWQVEQLLQRMDAPPHSWMLSQHEWEEWPRNRMIVLFFLYTGVRLSELADLKIEHLDMQEGRARIHGKGGKERVVPLHPELLKELRVFLGKSRVSGPLFLSRKGTALANEGISEMFRRWVVGRLGVQVTAHQLRHTFATQMRRQRADLRVIQKILGHAKLDTTMIYTAVYDEDLTQAIGELNWGK